MINDYGISNQCYTDRHKFCKDAECECECHENGEEWDIE